MPRTLTSVLVAILVFAAPAFAQSGPGKLELSIVPAGWISFASADDRPEPGFGQYLWGGSLTVNWSRIGIEGDLVWALGRTQNLELGTRTVSQKTPHVVVDAVNLVFPLTGNRGRIVPYIQGGIGETTVMRTPDNLTQPDTETLTTGDFGGGVKWFSAGRWGFRGDYRYYVIRSKFDAPGAFFGRELRKAHRVYGAIVVTLIDLP